MFTTEDARVLMKSAWPYHYEDGITNWVLWFGNVNASVEEIKGWIEQYAELEDFDLIVYENVKYVKTVPGIKHLQILARNTVQPQRKIYFHCDSSQNCYIQQRF